MKAYNQEKTIALQTKQLDISEKAIDDLRKLLEYERKATVVAQRMNEELKVRLTKLEGEVL